MPQLHTQYIKLTCYVLIIVYVLVKVLDHSIFIPICVVLIGTNQFLTSIIMQPDKDNLRLNLYIDTYVVGLFSSEEKNNPVGVNVELGFSYYFEMCLLCRAPSCNRKFSYQL